MSKKPIANKTPNALKPQSFDLNDAFNNQIITKNKATGEYAPIGNKILSLILYICTN